MPWTEAENLARSVRNDRPGKEAGTPERNQPMLDEVHSVLPPSRRQQEEADSGNVRESRITLIWELRQCIKQEAEYDGRATWSNDEQNLI